jgi:hypothetical protein
MHRASKRETLIRSLYLGLSACCWLAIGTWVAPYAALGQDSGDAALRDRVLQLVDRLDAPTKQAQDTAQASLIKLGPKILPLLPEASTAKTPERKTRLEKIRTALKDMEPDLTTAASKITIKGKGIRLSEALQQLQKQSGNAITDMREQLGSDVTNPAIDIDIEGKTFFEALDKITQLGDVTSTFATGDGTIGIMAGASMEAAPGAPAPKKAEPVVQYIGPFRVELKQLSLNRDLATGATTGNIQLEAAWEPRLRPMLMKLDYENLKILDDRKKEVAPQVNSEADEIVVRPENPVSEINLNIAGPEREAKKLASLKVKAELTIPSGMKTFKFPSLAEKNVTSKQGDVSMTLEDTEIDEQVWKVNVTLAYPGEGPAFESYRQGLFNNRLWLQRADGSRFEHNGGFSNTSSDGGKLSFEYLFVDAPGKPADYQLIYETPSKVITVPLAFEFKDIPLP